MFINLSGKVQIPVYLGLLPVFLQFYDGRLNIPVVTFVDFQGFLLHSFCGECPIAFRWFLHTEDIPGVTTTNPHLIEESTAFLVLKLVNGEDLLALHIIEAQNFRNLVVVVLKLVLVQQNGNSCLCHDSLFQNRG